MDKNNSYMRHAPKQFTMRFYRFDTLHSNNATGIDKNSNISKDFVKRPVKIQQYMFQQSTALHMFVYLAYRILLCSSIYFIP